VKRAADVVAGLAGLWLGTPSILTHVRHGANAVYQLQTGDAGFFLRITNDRHRSRGQLEAELDYIRFVASRGVAAACPLPSRRGADVETAHAANGESWHAVVFAAAPGRHFQFFSTDIDRALFRVWGSTMGALHTASRAFTPAALRRRPTWSEQDTTGCDLTGISMAESAVRREHACITEWLTSRRATPESWGMIHGDFERTNFVLDESTLRLFDFDDACYHWYVADIAHALWAFRNAPPDDRARFLAWFLEGYRERCDITGDIQRDLSWFVRLRSLSLFLNRLHAREALGVSEDGRWQQRMRTELAKPFWW
jgi:Ser/Thr protein kinase RdoA (MazF antagonist)